MHDSRHRDTRGVVVQASAPCTWRRDAPGHPDTSLRWRQRAGQVQGAPEAGRRAGKGDAERCQRTHCAQRSIINHTGDVAFTRRAPYGTGHMQCTKNVRLLGS